MRVAAVLFVIAVAGWLTPTAAANRAYGRFDAPAEQLLTFEFADAGAQVRAATVRMWMNCDQDYGFQYVAAFALTGHGHGDFLIRRSPGR